MGGGGGDMLPIRLPTEGTGERRGSCVFLLDFIWGTGGLGSLGDPLDTGLQQGWKAKQLRLCGAGVHMCACGCGVLSPVLLLFLLGVRGWGGVGRAAVCDIPACA